MTFFSQCMSKPAKSIRNWLEGISLHLYKVISSRDKYALAFEGANDGLWDWNLITGEVHHSARLKMMLELNEKDKFNDIRAFGKMLHQDDLEAFSKAIDDYILGNTQEFKAEYRMITKNGRTIWVLGRGKAIRDSKGKVIRIAGSNTDITQSRQAAEELKELTAMLRATFDSIPDPISVLDTNFNLVQSNTAGYQNFYRSTTKAIGGKCYEIKGKDEVCRDCIIPGVIRTKKPTQIERYSEANKRWEDVRIYPIFDEDNNVVRVIQHIRDIGNLKKAEIELQRSNAILSAQQEASIDGILIIDSERKVIGHNHRFLEQWSVPEDIINSSDETSLLNYVLDSVTYPEEFKNRVEELYSRPLASSLEKVYLKNGCVLDRYSGPILSTEGEPFGRVWYFRDITEKEAAHKALQKSAEENERLFKEVMEYDKLKSEFFANISHEFRTPINVIMSALQLMNIQLADSQNISSSEKTKRNIGIMKQNCYRLLKLTNNLIDMTKLDLGFFEINLQNYNIIEVVENITLSVAEYIENKGIELVFDTNTEERIIAIDADKIERILLNLLSNAVKFTEAQGMIWVSIRDKGESIEISVKDTGIGIPEDKLDIIFERFRQINSSLSRDQEGSGIGLSLVKNLVELHGGSIRVSSECGVGAEFTFELPVKTLPEKDDQRLFVSSEQSPVERVSLEFSDIYSL